MRKQTLSFLTIAVLFFGANIFVSNVLSQNKPFTMGQILRAIASINMVSDNDRKSHYSEILSAIRQRKVDFPLTKENKELLRNEGASDEFIEVIRKNSPPLITPTQTPTPVPTPTPKPVYVAYLERGDDFFNKFDFDRAIEEYNKVLLLDSENVNALVQRGYARHYKGDSNFDFADYNSAIKINPLLASEPEMICVLYDTTKDIADNAIENCGKAISAKPHFSLFYYKRANAHWQKKDYEQSINDYTKATELYQNFYIAYLNRGLTFVDKNDYDKALADFDKAIEIDAKDDSAYYYRAAMYLNKYSEDYKNSTITSIKDYNKAVNDINKAIELNPKFAGAYYVRGIMYRIDRKDDQALLEYTKAIELDPKFSGVYFNRGLIFISKGDYDKAIADYDKVIEINPKNGSAYNNRGTSFLRKKNYNRALENYNKAIELDKNNSSAYQSRAEVYEKMGEKDLAKQDRIKAEELRKNIKNKLLLQIKDR